MTTTLTSEPRDSLKPFATEASGYYAEIAGIKENIKDLV